MGSSKMSGKRKWIVFTAAALYPILVVLTRRLPGAWGHSSSFAPGFAFSVAFDVLLSIGFLAVYCWGTRASVATFLTPPLDISKSH